ncbi:hypothetical protein GOBAR_AA31232 [Gossypium barbadense]|uniref:Uncharacterized protein n=1 Tax=Gossypium barbadense TaxID=3634 RepID=A0A2P5WEE2_GOSBA|nr:hypothetical protein GOBAR_AA31232 [Gossypium barbadense]
MFLLVRGARGDGVVCFVPGQGSMGSVCGSQSVSVVSVGCLSRTETGQACGGGVEAGCAGKWISGCDSVSVNRIFSPSGDEVPAELGVCGVRMKPKVRAEVGWSRCSGKARAEDRPLEVRSDRGILRKPEMRARDELAGSGGPVESGAYESEWSGWGVWRGRARACGESAARGGEGRARVSGYVVEYSVYRCVW